MASTPSDDMEAFQRSSDQYEPEVAGPLIGEMQPITELIKEYADADPTYQTKTAALSATYSQYRRIKGDGQCGWRAAIFGYFEQLLNQEDPAKVLQELDRLKTFNTSMHALGFPSYMTEMFRDPALSLLENIHEALVHKEKGDMMLLQMMNGDEANNILYYFKLLTTTFMRFNPGQYQPFLDTSVSVDEYCKTRIEAHAQEIDQVGLQVLTDGVIAPAGMTLEVLYLDRSEGDEATPHPFVQGALNLPTIQLLYRPGHYDMIYKSSQTYSVQLQRQDVPSMTESHMDEQSYDMETLSTFLPGSTFATGVPANMWSGMAHQPYGSQHQTSNFAPAYQTPYDTYETLNYATPQEVTSPMLTTPYSEPSSATTALSAPVFPSSPGPPMLPVENQQGGIRLSSWVGVLKRGHHQTLAPETGVFKNSPHNPAHYHNVDFQPLMWNAEDEYGKP